MLQLNLWGTQNTHTACLACFWAHKVVNWFVLTIICPPAPSNSESSRVQGVCVFSVCPYMRVAFSETKHKWAPELWEVKIFEFISQAKRKSWKPEFSISEFKYLNTSLSYQPLFIWITYQKRFELVYVRVGYNHDVDRDVLDECAVLMQKRQRSFVREVIGHAMGSVFFLVQLVVLSPYTSTFRSDAVFSLCRSQFASASFATHVFTARLCVWRLCVLLVCYMVFDETVRLAKKMRKLLFN